MNNIESTKNVLSEMHEEIKKHVNILNGLLDNFKIKHRDFSGAVTNIEQQIKSAESKFTIAFVGTFKTGKSTIINSLLDLKGEARLSSEYDPDTAKSIRLVFAEGEYKDGEAVVDFGGVYPEERIPWFEAKRYTSQVALDNADKALREKASHIREVRYYVSSPLLKLCNILDLPGTGTGGHSEHTEVTNEKILESDCFFWVVSTSGEPDVETVKNLQKIKHKLLPIINVWQKECEGISSEFTPEHTIKTIQENYSAYLANADEPVIYYAGEIDNAQQKGEEIKQEWGKEKFTDKVESILQNIQVGDRAGRIESNIFEAISECRKVLECLKDDDTIVNIRKSVDAGSVHHKKTYERLFQCKRFAEGDIQKEANKTAIDIMDILADATDSFIYSKMDGLDFKALLRGKEKYGKELLKDYENNYIRLNSGWVEKQGEKYLDNVKTLLNGIYIDFEVNMDDTLQVGKMDSEMLKIGNFTERIAGGLNKDMMEKFVPMILEAVVAIVLLFIPGGNLVDSVYMIAAGLGNGKNVSNTDKLQSKAENIARSSRCQIRQQKSIIVNRLEKIGKKVADGYYSQIGDKLEEHGLKLGEQVKQLHSLEEEIQEFENVLREQEGIVKELFSK